MILAWVQKVGENSVVEIEKLVNISGPVCKILAMKMRGATP